MRRFTVPTLLCCCGLAASATAAEVQIFAARTTPKLDPIVEIQPRSVAAQQPLTEKPSIPAFATPERPIVKQSARPAAPAPATASARPAETKTAARTADATSTTKFAAVTPSGAPARPAAVQALVKKTTVAFAPVTPRGAPAAKKQFTYTDPAGRRDSAEVVRGYLPKQIASPIAKIDPSIDPRLRRAATIAQERARAYTRRRCWRYVKEALLASGAIDSYPKTVNAKEAGEELVRSYGFKKLPIRDPYAAPVGSVLVYYKGRNRPGHVELRTKDGFVSDFRSKTPDRHALLGVFAKRG